MTDVAGAAAQPRSYDEIYNELLRRLRGSVDTEKLAQLPRRDLIQRINELLEETLESGGDLSLAQQRRLIGDMVDQIQVGGRILQPDDDGDSDTQHTSSSHSVEKSAGGDKPAGELQQRTYSRVQGVKTRVQPILLDRIDLAVASELSPEELEEQIADIVSEILVELRVQLNGSEQRLLVRKLVDDMLGLGPLEPLLADESVTDIMVNGPDQVYVERRGKLQLTDVTFNGDDHVMNVATRIVTRIGRRIDESNPLVDARLEDGSRVNIIIPPLAIDGPSISIRKFAKKGITLNVMSRQGNVSEQLAGVLKIATQARLNVLISGGTGSGKTTLLNAMSEMIDHGERIVTIEDAAELQLQQPHVVRLETRPPSLEGQGEVTMRDLLKNSLRMRPDRIILGETRGAETLDMLQAMNTGHDGSMSTLHANSPREALTRLENMVAMSGIQLQPGAVRAQIADAINLIVQISRMRDGYRRVTRVSEVVGMEGDIVTMQDLFWYEASGERSDGRLTGRFVCNQLRPDFMPRAEHYSMGDKLAELMECRPTP